MFMHYFTKVSNSFPGEFSPRLHRRIAKLSNRKLPATALDEAMA